MFVWYKIKQLEKKIEEHKSWFENMAAETEEIKFTTYNELIQIKNSKDLNWEKAFLDEEIREAFYQLLLHRQFIGYHAEQLRKCKYDLLKLKGKAPSAFDKDGYSKVIEHGTSNNSMSILRNQLMDELKDDLLKFENEY